MNSRNANPNRICSLFKKHLSAPWYKVKVENHFTKYESSIYCYIFLFSRFYTFFGRRSLKEAFLAISMKIQVSSTPPNCAWQDRIWKSWKSVWTSEVAVKSTDEVKKAANRAAEAGPRKPSRKTEEEESLPLIASRNIKHLINIILLIYKYFKISKFLNLYYNLTLAII